MDERISEILDLGDNPVAVQSEAGRVLDCARWAALAFRRLDQTAVRKIAGAVAADRTLPYRDQDFVAPRLAGDRLEIPQPLGVVMALLPASEPRAALEHVALSCILTRNAVVFVPAGGSGELPGAIRALADKAEAAGLPTAAIQVVDPGRPALVEALLGSVEVDAILVVGDTPLAPLARSTGRNVLEVGSDDLAVFVDDTADGAAVVEWLAAASARGTRCSVVALEDAAAALSGVHVAPTMTRAIAALRRCSGSGRTLVVFSRDPQAILDVAAVVAAGRVVVNPTEGEAGFTPEQLLRWTVIDQPGGTVPLVDLGSAALCLPGRLPEAPADGVPGSGRRRAAGWF